MTDSILNNYKCYLPSFLLEGMKRENTCGKAEKVFIFADEDSDGTLNSEEYKRALYTYGYYPGAECQKDYEEAFKDIDTNNDGELSKEELEEFVNIEMKYKQIHNDFEYQNNQIPHHDKKGSIVLAALGIGSMALGLLCKRSILPSSKALAGFGIKVKKPKRLDFSNNVNSILSKLGLGIGLLTAAAGTTDVIIANNKESKRNKLMVEYSDKMYDVVKENPKSEYAKKCYNRLEEYFTEQSDESKFAPRYPWDDWF